MPDDPARLKDLGAIETAVWRELRTATRHPEHGWHVATLATCDGERADARCVVLREIDEATRTLLIYTDARSPKAAQIEAHPHGTLALWSSATGWQLRLRVELALQTAGLAVSSRWARLKMTPAAQDYLAPLPPGTPLPGPCLPQRQSREHFAVISARIGVFDWLELHPDGHRRARFGGADGPRFLMP